jgi:hypothetical protein
VSFDTSPAGCGTGFTTDFVGLAMNCILSLYSNWSKAGVASHIGTQGSRKNWQGFRWVHGAGLGCPNFTSWTRDPWLRNYRG